jgi:hypothetical protein
MADQDPKPATPGAPQSSSPAPAPPGNPHVPPHQPSGAPASGPVPSESATERTSSGMPSQIKGVQEVPKDAVEDQRVREEKPGVILPSQIPNPDPNANPIPPDIQELLPPPPPPPSPPSHHHDYSQVSQEGRQKLYEMGILTHPGATRPQTEEEREADLKAEERRRADAEARRARLGNQPDHFAEAQARREAVEKARREARPAK